MNTTLKVTTGLVAEPVKVCLWLMSRINVGLKSNYKIPGSAMFIAWYMAEVAPQPNRCSAPQY